MAKLLKIGIVGCGAIGASLAKTIVKDLSERATLSALFDTDMAKSRCLANLIAGNKRLAAASLKNLIKNSDLVIEAASSAASFKIAQEALKERRDIIIMSVGGIVNNYFRLLNLAKKHNARVYIPSGAICGIDGLKAMALEKIKKVVLTTSKNPLSFKGVGYIENKGIDLKKIKKEYVLFNGRAVDAVKHFPQNINVAAILSLAGIGPIKTQVRIIANPRISKNIHEIQIVSDAGVIYTRSENILHPKNPKTSYLAFLSAVAVLKQILEPVKIGA